MINVFDTEQDLAQYITDITGVKCYLTLRSEQSKEHFVVDLISDTDTFADDTVYKYYSTYQLTFLTKNPYDRNKHKSELKKTLRATTSFNYVDDDEWYNTIYEFKVTIKNEREA